VARALQHRQLTEELRRLKEQAPSLTPVGTLLGESPVMQHGFDLVRRAADSDASVLVTGESGTGKELVARALHEHSHRPGAPFVALNCAAISAQLLESELFGHVRGAFTDARTDRTGLFVESSGGTLFLDELGEMPLEMQSRLFRALQERHARPVGSSREVELDTRIVAATNRDIDAAVERREFREDLFYRINVVRISVPPRRSRGNDILLLANRFLEPSSRQAGKHIDGFVPDAARRLLDYDWPGNARELENLVERALILTRFDNITVEDLPERVREHRSDSFVVPAEDLKYLPTSDEFEERYIGRVLKVVGGNKTQAAKILGVDRRTPYRKLEREGEAPGPSAEGSGRRYCSAPRRIIALLASSRALALPALVLVTVPLEGACEFRVRCERVLPVSVERAALSLARDSEGLLDGRAPIGPEASLDLEGRVSLERHGGEVLGEPLRLRGFRSRCPVRTQGFEGKRHLGGCA